MGAIITTTSPLLYHSLPNPLRTAPMILTISDTWALVSMVVWCICLLRTAIFKHSSSFYHRFLTKLPFAFPHPHTKQSFFLYKYSLFLSFSHPHSLTRRTFIENHQNQKMWRIYMIFGLSLVRLNSVPLSSHFDLLLSSTALSSELSPPNTPFTIVWGTDSNPPPPPPPVLPKRRAHFHSLMFNIHTTHPSINSHLHTGYSQAV